MGWTELLAELKLRRQQFDRQTVRFCAQVERENVRIYCQKGCSNCCSLAVNCSFPEVISLEKSLTDEQRQALREKIPSLRQISRQAQDLKQFLRLFRQQLEGCPFISNNDGSCAVYAQRPLSCRALHSTRNSSWCAVDFAELHPLEKEAFLSSLDPEVVAFPTHYLGQSQELGSELEVLTLADMREAFGISLSGNMLYLLWLEMEHKLSELISEAPFEIQAYLEQRQLDLPFLLQLQRA